MKYMHVVGDECYSLMSLAHLIFHLTRLLPRVCCRGMFEAHGLYLFISLPILIKVYVCGFAVLSAMVRS